jgi:hypothetical protein
VPPGAASGRDAWSGRHRPAVTDSVRSMEHLLDSESPNLMSQAGDREKDHTAMQKT